MLEQDARIEHLAEHGAGIGRGSEILPCAQAERSRDGYRQRHLREEGRSRSPEPHAAVNSAPPAHQMDGRNPDHALQASWASFRGHSTGSRGGHRVAALQACDASRPRSLAALEALVAVTSTRRRRTNGVYLTGMESWFRPAWMKQLDEAGIPLPLGERLRSELGGATTGREALMLLSKLDTHAIGHLTPMDRFIIQLAAGKP